MTKSVSSVEKVIPPIMAIPIGCHSSEPSPRPNAIGSIPRIVVIEVISTGRRRLLPEATTASRAVEPRSINRFV